MSLFYTGDSYGGDRTVIDLEFNNLTRFESTVFKSILEQMKPFGGVPNSYILLNFSFQKKSQDFESYPILSWPTFYCILRPVIAVTAIWLGWFAIILSSTDRTSRNLLKRNFLWRTRSKRICQTLWIGLSSTFGAETAQLLT